MQHVDPGVGWEERAYTTPPAYDRWNPGRQFGAAFIAMAAWVTAAWLWAVSGPGMSFIPGIAAFLGMSLAAVLWLGCAALTGFRVITGRSKRAGWYLFVVPLIGLAAVASTVTHLPERVRFEQARSQFDEYAASVVADASILEAGELPTADEFLAPDDPRSELVSPEAPDRLGSYRIQHVRVMEEGVVIDVAGTSGFFAFGGYVYLHDESASRPQFGEAGTTVYRPLGGGWYSYTAHF